MDTGKLNRIAVAVLFASTALSGCAPAGSGVGPDPAERSASTVSAGQVADAMAQAEAALADGDVDAAYEVLLPLSTKVRGDARFRELYQRTVSLKWTLDARKAHVQHAREQTDGALAPEDVIR